MSLLLGKSKLGARNIRAILREDAISETFLVRASRLSSPRFKHGYFATGGQATSRNYDDVFSFPTPEALYTIFSEIFNQHMAQPTSKFLPTINKYSRKFVEITLAVHSKMTATFLPTAIKFHYIFNIRDLSNIFQVRQSEKEGAN